MLNFIQNKERIQFLQKYRTFFMKSLDSNQSHQSAGDNSQHTDNMESCSNVSQDRLTGFESFQSLSSCNKNRQSTAFKQFHGKNLVKVNNDDSFYSESNQIKVEEVLDDDFLLQKKVEKRDIIFQTNQLKQTFITYFTDVIYGFLKQPSENSFQLAIGRLKFYNEESPFETRNSKAESDKSDKHNSSFNSNDSEVKRSSFSNCKTAYSSEDLRIDFSELITVEHLLRSMFYQNQYQFMVYTFDYVICHMTFLAVMLYFWSMVDHSNDYLNFARSSELQSKVSQQKSKSLTQELEHKNNIYKTLKLYVQERSQCLNICQINILIVYFFLNYLKTSRNFQEKDKEIQNIQQNFISSLKIYRRIKKMQREFEQTSNQVILKSQLHKYEYENKLIESMEKTFLIFQFLNTHNFVSSPLQKYYQLYEFKNSRRNYHFKRDYLCIWIMEIILRLCEKKSAESLSKSSFYIITFLAVLKKFKENGNYEGISMIVPILCNIKEQLPKVWNHAQSRRIQINRKLQQYVKMLTEKIYKKEQVPVSSNAIISEEVIYQMCSKFQKYSKIQNSGYISVQKHKKFYDEFLVHIIYHRKEIFEEYSDEIENYKKEREIGISFNLYLLDTYICKINRFTNSKNLWNKLTQKSKKINSELNYNLYIDLIDYCFIGSTLKYKQLQI